MIEAVMFDFDGTVADTNHLVYESFRVTLKEKLQVEPQRQDIYDLFGEPLERTLKRYVDDIEDILAYYRAFNEENHDALIQPFPGVEAALRDLQAMGVKLGIVTSKRRAMALRGIEVLGLGDYFDVVITPEDTRNHKPSADPLLKGLERLGGIPPERVLMVGDSVFDIKCGQNAGARTVGVTYTVVGLEKLEALRPDYFVDALTELVDIVRELNGKTAT